MSETSITIFSGAGFSKGLAPEFPLTRDLLQEIRKRSLPKRGIDLREIDDLEKKAITEKKEQPFEEVLKEIYDRRSEEKYEYLYRLLVNGVALTTRFKHPGFLRYPDQSLPLGKYIDALQKLNSVGKLRLISTNYDLINDKAAQWINDRILGLPRNISPPKDLRRFQYGFKVSGVWTSDASNGTNFDEDYFQNPIWEEIQELIHIYKLHGSSNWVYCDNCRSERELHLSRTFNDVKKIFSVKSNPVCSRCMNPYLYSIIPPMPYKNIEADMVLKAVWSKAEITLINSSHIIFIGYSMPDADPLVRNLIKKTFSKDKKYYLMEKCADVINKFRDLFGDNLIEVFDDGYSSLNLHKIHKSIEKELI